MRISVSAYSGYRGDESPRYFFLDNHRVSIVEILARWRTPENRYFKVSGEDGNTYIIFHDGDNWNLEE